MARDMWPWCHIFEGSGNCTQKHHLPRTADPPPPPLGRLYPDTRGSPAVPLPGCILQVTYLVVVGGGVGG